MNSCTTKTNNPAPNLQWVTPISGMAHGSFTHTQKEQPDGATDRYGRNNNSALDSPQFQIINPIAIKAVYSPPTLFIVSQFFSMLPRPNWMHTFVILLA